MRLRLASVMLACAALDLALAVRWGAEAGSHLAEPRCESSFTASAPLPVKAPPGGLRLQVCRGGACDLYDLAGAPLALAASSVCDGSCYVQDGVVQVSRTYRDAAELVSGERYSVRLFDPVTARTYAAAQGLVRYVTVPATMGDATVEATSDGSAICRLGEVTAQPAGGS
jgi:hypothetical protein